MHWTLHRLKFETNDCWTGLMLALVKSVVFIVCLPQIICSWMNCSGEHYERFVMVFCDFWQAAAIDEHRAAQADRAARLDGWTALYYKRREHPMVQGWRLSAFKCKGDVDSSWSTLTVILVHLTIIVLLGTCFQQHVVLLLEKNIVFYL